MAKKKTTARKKSTAKKAPARRTSTAKKAAVKKKSSTRSAGTVAAPARKKTAKKAPAKKKTAVAAGKAPAKKSTAKKTTTKKSTAKKATTKKSTASKAAGVKKNAATKAPTKKKASAKKATNKPAASPSKTPTKKKTAAKDAKPKSKTAAKAATKKTAKKRRKPLGSQSVAEAASAAEADAQGYVFINGRRVRMISTGGVGLAIKSRARKAESTVETVVEPKKPTKTHLTAKELRSYREILLQKRRELLGDLTALEKASLESGGGSHLSNHMADAGSDTYDQDFMLGMAETERAQLREIDEALDRIAKKTYGVCELTGEEIPKARLNAKPWARYTIEAARKMEGRWGS